MNAVVFVGPTLCGFPFSEHTNIEWMPPVRRGDLLRALRQSPCAIGIIDGYFETVASVSHKEILWALWQGVPVFGSSSMGAIRAAELSRYGMVGIGKIFECFRDGILTDDDEVALVHAPMDLGYLPASEAIVNIRATLDRAQAEGVIDEKNSRALLSIAQSTFYKRRNWSQLLDRASNDGLPALELKNFRAWLPHGTVDQKRLDANSLLEVIQCASVGSRKTTIRADFDFRHTVNWEMIVQESFAVR